MASWRIRQSYGFGAARVPLAPVHVPGPWTEPASLAEGLAGLAEELAEVDARAWLRRGGALIGLVAALSFVAVLVTPDRVERDAPVEDLVLLLPEPVVTPEVAQELLPPPEPIVEPEPEVLPEPEPLPLAKAEPKPKLSPQPPPVALRPEPLRAEPPPAPKPQVVIEPLAAAPAPPPALPPPLARSAPPARQPAVKIDPLAPSFAVAASAPPAAAAEPLRATTRSAPRAAPPVSFALDPLPGAQPAPPASAAPAPQLARTAPRSAPMRAAAAPAMPRFDPVAPPARYADAAAAAPPPAAAARVERTAATREESWSPPPKKAFQGVPLGSLAACVSDREEDSLKLRVMAAAGARAECTSRAGSYRFVETKNLNAFLMWIERNPSRKAADRCIELRLALECLAGTSKGRTDKG